MTEAEWLTCTHPFAMLEFLRGKASGRKLRLIGCGCCRRVWHLLSDLRPQLAVECAERYADGTAADEERRLARHGAQMARGSAPKDRRIRSAIKATYEVANLDPMVAAYSGGYIVPSGYIPTGVRADDHEELTRHSLIIRDIFGNPFRPVTFLPEWLTSTVVSLANQMYDSRDFSAMPILADALEDSGCDDGVVLQHCRGPGPHVRGCWCVDLLTGRE